MLFTLIRDCSQIDQASVSVYSKHLIVDDTVRTIWSIVLSNVYIIAAMYIPVNI